MLYYSKSAIAGGKKNALSFLCRCHDIITSKRVNADAGRLDKGKGLCYFDRAIW
jgi:hypothetical protein